MIMHETVTTTADGMVDGVEGKAAELIAEHFDYFGCFPSSFTLHIGVGVFREHRDVAARLMAVRSAAGLPVRPVEEPPSPSRLPYSRDRFIELRCVP